MVVGLVDKQDYWTFALLHQVAQVALTLFGRCGYINVLFRGQMVIERSNQGRQINAVFLDSEGRGNDDLLLVFHHLLTAP